MVIHWEQLEKEMSFPETDFHFRFVGSFLFSKHRLIYLDFHSMRNFFQKKKNPPKRIGHFVQFNRFDFPNSVGELPFVEILFDYFSNPFNSCHRKNVWEVEKKKKIWQGSCVG
jgi:hypothetical protein